MIRLRARSRAGRRWLFSWSSERIGRSLKLWNTGHVEGSEKLEKMNGIGLEQS
jgi:hypothetical protein